VGPEDRCEVPFYRLLGHGNRPPWFGRLVPSGGAERDVGTGPTPAPVISMGHSRDLGRHKSRTLGGGIEKDDPAPEP